MDQADGNHIKFLLALTSDPSLQAFFARAARSGTPSLPAAPDCRDWPTGMRMIPVEDDCMEPTLRSGDVVGVFPVSEFGGEGIYIINSNGYPRVYRATSDAKNGVKMISDNTLYGSFALTREVFDDLVLGKVSLLCKVIDRPGWAG